MKRIGLLVLAGITVFSVALADGNGSSKGIKRGGSAKATSNAAETGLVGVKLYDTGLQVVKLYGSPDDIQDVASGGGGPIGPSGAGAGGAGGGPRPGGGGPRPNSGGGPGGGPGAGSADAWHVPDLDYTPINLQSGPPGVQGPGRGGPPTPGGGGQAPAGAGGGGGGSDNRVVYTRWVYKRGNSRYAFILNRYNQVIQIEAIGANDSRVHTNRGIRYGAQFADIVKKYGAPDGYEISGNTLVLRYLVNAKVAFRLNRLETNGKHVVTGVVVAAGKM